MAIKTEVWRSDDEGHKWPETFAKVSLMESNIEPGGFNDTTAELDKVYVYRFRNLNTATNMYSGWSDFVRITAPSSQE